MCLQVAALGRRHYVALIFDCSRAEECLPVRGSCLGEEGRRDEQDLGTFQDQLSVELREADIVRDAQAEVAYW